MPLKPKSKKRGSKSASFEENFTGSEKDLSDYIRASAKYLKVQQPADDDEAFERISDMFEDCAMNNSVPTVEKLALCLGTTIEMLRHWEYRGDKGQFRSLMIKRAKQIIASIDAEAVLNGKLNTICYLFRAKNYYGMSDNVTIEHKTVTPLGDSQDQSMLVNALLKQLQGQATMQQLPSDYQPQLEQSAINQAPAEFKQATINLPDEKPSDYGAEQQQDAKRLSSDYEPQSRAIIAEDAETPSDYETEVRATINPLSALGKALAEELSSDYDSEKLSDYDGEIIDIEPEKDHKKPEDGGQK